MKNLKALVERVLAENPDDRTFPLIQNNAIVLTGMDSELSLDRGLPLELNKGESLYRILQELKEKYGVRLFTPELEKTLSLLPMPIRACEVLGQGLENLAAFYDKAKEAKAEIDVLVIAERGYIYSIKLEDKYYVMKHLQGESESEIARISSDELEIGPKVEEIGSEWLVEEFVHGVALENSGIIIKKTIDILAHICSLLHTKCIVYGDNFERHTLLTRRGPVLIDYGISYFGDDFSPDLERARTYLKQKNLYEATVNIPRFNRKYESEKKYAKIGSVKNSNVS